MSKNSLNISAENRHRLKTLFPSVFTEIMNDQGELVESVDFEKLKAELGTFTDFFEGRREHYGMEWSGKKDALRLIQITSAATLKPCTDESINFDTTQNIFIEGENLEVLKLLQKSYNGQVKMIYIDPPYNTGKDFIYHDNFTESLDAYLEYAGPNAVREGRFHTKWLNMMYPRLYLARNLLRDDGVIFISIDDNEVSNLRKLCDEIFGEENFIAELIWKSRQNVDSRSVTGISNDHEYVLCYSKTAQYRLRGQEINKEKYSNPDNDPRGAWMNSALDGIATRDKRPNLHYAIINPETGLSYNPNPANGWRFQRSTMAKLIEENRILWPKNPTSKPRFKRYLNELSSLFTGFSSLITGIFTLEGTRELREIMGMETVKFPKPVNLIKKLIQQAFQDNGDIFLDFFAGSATTAHAVLDLNKQDGGNRKFILVQIPEPCAPDSEAFKAGYKTIADIGKERIRRVIKNLNKEDKGREGEDRGFRVLKLDEKINL
jgi:adenine-specific DNA-methyltransferase